MKDPQNVGDGASIAATPQYIDWYDSGQTRTLESNGELAEIIILGRSSTIDEFFRVLQRHCANTIDFNSFNIDATALTSSETGQMDAQLRAVVVAMMSANRPTEHQNALALRLGLPPTTFNNSITTAKQNGWYKESPTIIKGKIPKDLLKKAQEYIACADKKAALKNQLSNLLKSTSSLPEIHVVRVPPRTTPGRLEPKEWDANVALVAKDASEWLIEQLRRIRKLGVAWGTALDQLAANLQSSNRTRREISVVPLSGDTPCDKPVRCWSSTMLARDVASAVSNLDVNNSSISLAGFPSSIPGALSAKAAKETVEYWTTQRQYKVFLEALKTLDTILTGAGGVGKQFLDDPLFAHRLTNEDEKHWVKTVSGDIGGCVFPKLEKPGTSFLENVSQRWLGLSLACLRSVAASAVSDRKRCGVVVVCYGREKAEVLLEAIRQQCVNVLFIDDDLCDAMTAFCRDHNSLKLKS